jgi:predicted YcjX-like family ATPase
MDPELKEKLLDLNKKLEELYEKIADARSEDLPELVDEATSLSEQIEEISNPKQPPLSKTEFESYYSLERKYESFHDEYGDSAAFYSDYLEYHYQNYLESYKKGRWYSL